MTRNCQRHAWLVQIARPFLFFYGRSVTTWVHFSVMPTTAPCRFQRIHKTQPFERRVRLVATVVDSVLRTPYEMESQEEGALEVCYGSCRCVGWGRSDLITKMRPGLLVNDRPSLLRLLEHRSRSLRKSRSRLVVAGGFR